MRQLLVHELGLVDYAESLSRQLDYVSKSRAQLPLSDELWLLSHPEVITLGASRDAKENIKVDTKIPVHKISRGGDVTYHDPGQITGYFLFYLKDQERDLHRFLNLIEQSLIECLDTFQVGAHRVDGKTGVWFENKKVCSIGIACRHWTTYHGFSLNIDSNLANYGLMNPCGLESSTMANTKDFFPMERSEFLERYPDHCARIFGRKLA